VSHTGSVVAHPARCWGPGLLHAAVAGSTTLSNVLHSPHARMLVARLPGVVRAFAVSVLQGIMTGVLGPVYVPPGHQLPLVQSAHVLVVPYLPAGQAQVPLAVTSREPWQLMHL